MKELERFGRRVAQVQDHTSRSAADLAVVRRRLQAMSARRRWVPAGVVVGLAAAAAIVWSWAPTSAAAPAIELDGAPTNTLVTAEHQARQLRFSDGTLVRLLPTSQARVTNLDVYGAEVVLEEGNVDAVVVPRPQARWAVRAGPYTVRVVGTAFTVRWSPSRAQLEVAVRSGRVEVFGPAGHSVTLGQGDRLKATGDMAWHVEADAGAGPSPRVEPEPPRPENPAVEASRTPRAKPRPTLDVATWRRLADDGRSLEALAAAERAGFDALLGALDADGLLALADVARVAGVDERARPPLLRLRQRFPHAPEATAAAFRLGRLMADDAPAEAARWFIAYADEAPDGQLAREALGRALELGATLEVETRRKLAQRYLARWPTGPHSALALQALQAP